MQSKNKVFSFLKKFGNTRHNEAPPPLPDFKDDNGSQTPPKIKVPKREAPKIVSKATPLAKGISLLVGIYYRNEENEVEKRRITIRRIWEKSGKILVDAFCHETKAPRLFSLSRIAKIVDLKAKRAFSNPKAFILNQIDSEEEEAAPPQIRKAASDNSQTSQAIKKIRNELTCLVFLAQTDSDFSQIEQKVIADYAVKRNPNINIDINELNEYINRIYPDEESFYDAVDALLDKPEQILTEFVETFIKLILSDGIVHDNEREFLAELLLVLKEEGIDIKTNM